MPLTRAVFRVAGPMDCKTASGVASPKYDGLIKRARSWGRPPELLSIDSVCFRGAWLEPLPLRLSKELKLAAPSSSPVRPGAKESMELTSSLRNESRRKD
ncbi:hypothetical protein NE237_000073 [Protea cynaroides]|uniref:Uncharacterized protein n=1 Tax=Protea cynaroides TaxID=273540 RepID=A0A9Q0GNZ7_9MAGN|nr:hypothetical protein NE237_000073 [Protea cynaroides]